MRFADAVEIDETKVGSMFFKYEGRDFKWVFGFCDRKSKITVMYFVQNRKKPLLHGIIKKHCHLGCTIFSDSASIYT
jgi:hypothetical protein